MPPMQLSRMQRNAIRMGCLPNATAYARDGVSAIYFEAENGDGVLMPARPKK